MADKDSTGTGLLESARNGAGQWVTNVYGAITGNNKPAEAAKLGSSITEYAEGKAPAGQVAEDAAVAGAMEVGTDIASGLGVPMSGPIGQMAAHGMQNVVNKHKDEIDSFGAKFESVMEKISEFFMHIFEMVVAWLGTTSFGKWLGIGSDSAENDPADPKNIVADYLGKVKNNGIAATPLTPDVVSAFSQVTGVPSADGKLSADMMNKFSEMMSANPALALTLNADQVTLGQLQKGVGQTVQVAANTSAPVVTSAAVSAAPGTIVSAEPINIQEMRQQVKTLQAVLKDPKNETGFNGNINGILDGATVATIQRLMKKGEMLTGYSGPVDGVPNSNLIKALNKVVGDPANLALLDAIIPNMSKTLTPALVAKLTPEMIATLQQPAATTVVPPAVVAQAKPPEAAAANPPVASASQTAAASAAKVLTDEQVSKAIETQMASLQNNGPNAKLAPEFVTALCQTTHTKPGPNNTLTPDTINKFCASMDQNPALALELNFTPLTKSLLQAKIMPGAGGALSSNDVVSGFSPTSLRTPAVEYAEVPERQLI